MLEILLVHEAARLQQIDEYSRGIVAGPYIPDFASAEYNLLAQRCSSNWAELLVRTPTQGCYVDSFRPGRKKPEEAKSGEDELPEWKHWQHSRLDSRQIAIHRAAVTFGHSFTLTERVGDKVITKGLSPLRTIALFRDPANDETPLWGLTITRDAGPGKDEYGQARVWDSTYEYLATFRSAMDFDSIRVKRVGLHGATECPITRFTAGIDLEGRTVGVIEPVIPLIDRINQTIFDLLVAQTYASIKVRTVSGMAPPVKMRLIETEDGEALVPELDDQGKPIPEPIRGAGSRFMYAKDPAVKFGQLDETPLSGFVESVDMSIRQLSAISQTPPNYLVGQIANLSADALKAAEIALSRKIAEFRTSFGESWERVMRLAGELMEIAEAADDYSGEVIWRDVNLSSLAQAADGLGKLKEQLEIPARALWSRVPNVTDNELREWSRIWQDEDLERRRIEAQERAFAGTVQRPRNAPPRTPTRPAAPSA